MGQLNVRFVCCVFLSLALCSCSAPNSTRDRSWVSEELSNRVGAGIPLEPGLSEPSFPAGVEVEDGLDIDEAVAYSLWNHPDFSATVAELGVSRAELHQAGLLRNPVLSLLFPLGPKQFEATLMVAVDALWQRNDRIEIARSGLLTLSERLISTGLGRAQLTRQSYVDALRLRRRIAIQTQVVALEEKNIYLLDRALKLGDISGIVVEKARIQRDISKLDLDESDLEMSHALAVLRESLGGDLEPTGTDLVEIEDLAFMSAASVDELCQRALAARPDLRAIEFELEAGMASLGLAKKTIPSLELIIDANGEGFEGFEVGPGVLAEIPIFDTGGARVDIAESKLLVVVARRRALERRIREDVRRLFADYTRRLLFLSRAQREFESGRKIVTDALAVQRRLGETNDLELLAYSRLVLAQELKLAEWKYQVQSAHVALEAAVGTKLTLKSEESR